MAQFYEQLHRPVQQVCRVLNSATLLFILSAFTAFLFFPTSLQATSANESLAVDVKIELSKTTFKGDMNISSAIGQFSTADDKLREASYELVEGVGSHENKFFSIVHDQLFLKSTSGLAGQAKFRIRVRNKQNNIEAVFVLTKTAYQAEQEIKIVNAFSPNGDFKNDTWLNPDLRYYDLVQIEVYDRAGNRLFYTKNPEEGWDGSNLNGQVVPGAYFYMIQVEDVEAVYRGVVTVLKK